MPFDYQFTWACPTPLINHHEWYYWIALDIPIVDAWMMGALLFMQMDKS